MATASAQEFARFVRENLPLAPVPTVAEIRLHRAGPRSGLWRLAEWNHDFATPYWAYPWGGGLALARYVLDHPDTVAGRRILDLGAGSGLVGIAAARSGAKSVLAADIDSYAASAARLNAAANDVAIESVFGDLTQSAPPDVDLILIGDLFYEQALAERVSRFLDRCLKARIGALIGDPGRSFLPRSRLQLLAEYPGPDFGDGDRGTRARNAVFFFRA